MRSETEATAPSDADEIEQYPCPRGEVQPGSPCRSRSGAVASTYHTGRFTKLPHLAKELRVPTADRASPGGRAPRRRHHSRRTHRARTSASATPAAPT